MLDPAILFGLDIVSKLTIEVSFNFDMDVWYNMAKFCNANNKLRVVLHDGKILIFEQLSSIRKSKKG